jgi:DNA (cytosine-5)-methyltransferase 1
MEAGEENIANALRSAGDGHVGDQMGYVMSPAVAHETAIRRLTPLECERLQGFPDRWTDGQSDSARYRQLGNAVAVPVVEWITRRIAALEASSSATEAGAA